MVNRTSRTIEIAFTSKIAGVRRRDLAGIDRVATTTHILVLQTGIAVFCSSTCVDAFLDGKARHSGSRSSQETFGARLTRAANGGPACDLVGEEARAACRECGSRSTTS